MRSNGVRRRSVLGGAGVLPTNSRYVLWYYQVGGRLGRLQPLTTDCMHLPKYRYRYLLVLLVPTNYPISVRWGRLGRHATPQGRAGQSRATSWRRVPQWRPSHPGVDAQHSIWRRAMYMGHDRALRFATVGGGSRWLGACDPLGLTPAGKDSRGGGIRTTYLMASHSALSPGAAADSTLLA